MSDHDEDLLRCDCCMRSIPGGEPCNIGGDTCVCIDCAPTYQDLIDSPQHFYDSEDNVMTAGAAREIFDAHIAAGGKPDDKVVAA